VLEIFGVTGGSSEKEIANSRSEVGRDGEGLGLVHLKPSSMEKQGSFKEMEATEREMIQTGTWELRILGTLHYWKGWTETSPQARGRENGSGGVDVKLGIVLAS